MNLRIHVERAVERINFFFRIIQGVVPISLYDKMSKRVFVVCAICYLMPSLIQSKYRAVNLHLCHLVPILYVMNCSNLKGANMYRSDCTAFMISLFPKVFII